MTAPLPQIPLAKLAGVYFPDRTGRAGRRNLPFYYVRHPVRPGPQPMIRVHREGNELRILDFLTVLPVNAPTVKEPLRGVPTRSDLCGRKELVFTNSVLSAAFRLLDKVYKSDIDDYDAYDPFFKIDGDASRPPYLSADDQRLFKAMQELLDAELEREAACHAAVLRPTSSRKRRANLAALLRRIATAKERNPTPLRTLREVSTRLRSWTPYNIQEGRVARSKQWRKEWRIFSLWNRWELNDDKWFARAVELRPGAARLGPEKRETEGNTLAKFCARHGLIPASRK